MSIHAKKRNPGAVFQLRRVERQDRRRSKAENEGFPTAPVSSLNSSNCERYGTFFKIQALFDFDGYSLMNVIIQKQNIDNIFFFLGGGLFHNLRK